jgi:MSHA pilin protein MshD
MCIKAAHHLQAERGLSLIELLVFIVIVGIAATAILGVFGSLTRSSAGLLPDKQAQAIAASMLREIMAQPYTYCDPNSPNASTAAAATVAACGGPAENNFALEAGENFATRTTLDNVNDYNGYNSAGVSFPDGTVVPSLAGYSVSVRVASAGAISGVPAAATLRVTVTVTPPTGAPAILDGVRIRYAPKT